MKNTFLSPLLLLFFFSVSNGQLVDTSISGIQAGLLGVWWHNESKLAHRWAFRTEIGYAAPVYERNLYREEVSGNENYLFPVFQPVFCIEPRWYYNSRKRQGNSNNTFHNSGNYFTAAFQYNPKFLAYSPSGNTNEPLAFDAEEPNGGLFITPTWGMRRNINYRWNFEIGAGLGIDISETQKRTTVKEAGHMGNDFVFNIHLRIGYKYGMKE
ncbi:hypothetical protein [uncultured Maribacter sp.]|uniref:hypothetical protein n=1 Tax=uncultured Maribacter sp. TaxID=431308 RepID=UPI002616BB73|nr:hypothetical protein [uncultured Maribacter sp.]